MWGKTEQVRTSGKHLIDIPEIKAGTGNGRFNCHISANTVLHARKDSVNVERSIWRIAFNYKDGSIKYITDDRLDSYSSVPATEDNPIESVDYRDVYVISGRYTDIQLEYGSSPTTYEPYSGGKPSPSPDYPQPIEITDQPVTVTIKGGTEQQSITLTPPRPFTKWDKLEKVDGVWCWVYQHNEYTVTGEESFSTGDSQYTEGSSTDCFIQVLKDAPRKADGRMERLSAVDVVWSKLDAVGFCLNINQLHMRLPNFLLGVSDDAIASEKIAAYKAYVKAEYDKGTPYHVIYETTTPEPISLSPSEQGKLNAITMYAGTTEVTNTGGCNMELTYTVDTKSYVDSKIAAISAAVLEV